MDATGERERDAAVTVSRERVEECLGDRWVLEFDRDTEMPVLRRLDDLLGDGVFWDVGAHAGLYSVVAAGLRPRLDVYAFEPSPVTRDRYLSGNVADLDVTVVPHPLTDEPGPVTYLDDRAGGTTNALASATIAPDDGEPTTVEGHTARSAVDRLGVEPPDVVKIDVEGAERQVLEGFDDTLIEGVSALLCELHHVGGRDTAPTAWLEAHGFEVRTLASRRTGADRRQEHVLAVAPEADIAVPR